MTDNPKGIRKFDREVNSFIVLSDPNDRIGIIFEFVFGNGLGVSVADHSGISHNDLDVVSVAIVDTRTNKIISRTAELDHFFRLQGGVTCLNRVEVPDFLNQVESASVLDFITLEIDQND